MAFVPAAPAAPRRAPRAVLSPARPAASPPAPPAPPAPPPPPAAPAPAPARRALRAYEAFLNAGGARAADAPVFAAAAGGLVCEWPRAGAPPAPAAELARYAAFLASPAAAGVDPARPVFRTAAGLLVCRVE